MGISKCKPVVEVDNTLAYQHVILLSLLGFMARRLITNIYIEPLSKSASCNNYIYTQGPSVELTLAIISICLLSYTHGWIQEVKFG
jgi:hypothetical protein